MKRKLLVYTLVCSMLLPTLLTGCGGSTAKVPGKAPAVSGAADSAKTGDGEKIRIVEWSQGEKVMKLKQEIAKEVFPNIDYQYVLVNNNDYLTKLQTALATGTDVPDIITCEITSRGAVFGLDILENLEAAPYSYDRSQLFDAVIPALTNAKDELVSLDNQFCPAGFAYNRELTKKYFGVEEPDDVYQLVKDWDSFIATGLKLKESGDEVFMMQGMFDLLELLAGQNAKDFIDGDTVDITGRYKAALETACKIRDAGVPLGTNEKNSTSWNAAYTNGSTIFFNHASWSTNSCIASNDKEKTTMGKWGFCMAPGGSWMNGGTSVGIYKNSPNKEAVWEFMKYFQGSSEGYTQIYDKIGWIPSFKAFYEGDSAPINNDFLYSDWFGGQNICKYMYDNIAVGVSPYEKQTAHSTLIVESYRDMSLQYLINPKLTPDEGLQYLKEKIATQEPSLTLK